MKFLNSVDIPRPTGGNCIYSRRSNEEVANKLGYPVLVRPSYVLGGQGMQIATCDEDS